MKKDFDLNLLPIAMALYEELAARKLGMSQPALSEVLGKLRKVLDDELEKHRFFKQRLLVYGPVCLMRAGHFFKGDSLSLKEYLEFGHVEVDTGHALARSGGRCFGKKK